MHYFFIKLIHILSATLLFGTGLGSAFYNYYAYKTQNIATIAFASRYVVIADWLFTTPAVILQPLTGIVILKTRPSLRDELTTRSRYSPF